MELQIVDFARCSTEHDKVDYEDLKSVGESIYKSFATIGFVYLKNTGINDSDAAEIRALFKRFFSLDITVKASYCIDENGYGYVAAGVENSDPHKPGEFKEVFDISGPGFVSDSSKWPDAEMNGFSKTTKVFMERCRTLGLRIFDALAVGMDLTDKDYFRNCHSRLNNVRNMTTLRNLYYPVIPKDYVVKEGEMRLGEHTDWGSLTILFQDDVGGLQVQRSDGEYIDATPIPGTALINIGDALEYWTRGALRSTKHRIAMPEVLGPRNVERYSLVYFIRPDNEVVLSEVEYHNSSVDIKPPSNENYKTITVLQHLQKKYSEANMPPPQD